MLSSRTAITHKEFVLLREYILQESGIVIKDEKVFTIESRLARLVIETGCQSFKEFYLKAKNDVSKRLRDKIIEAISTNETLWFRDLYPFTILREVIVPKMINELQMKRKEVCLIWAAAASTGQEPYSIAMIIDDAIKKEPRVSREQFHILATSVSPNALYIAISGRYNSATMSIGMIPEYKEKYFVTEKGISEVKEDIKKMVTFKSFNLLSDFSILPTFDIIFCRNAMIAF